MSQFEAYSLDGFNSLPTINEACESFRNSSAQLVVDSALKDLFIRYEVTDILGVALVHRHFALEENQLLVEANGTSVPWTLPDISKIEDKDGTINPHSWAVQRGRLMPFEFSFELHNIGPEITPKNPFADINPAFFAEFTSTLMVHGLENVLGLRLINGQPGQRMEISRGKANIELLVTQEYCHRLRDQYTDVVWVYDELEDGSHVTRGCQHCREMGVTRSGNVRAHV